MPIRLALLVACLSSVAFSVTANELLYFTADLSTDFNVYFVDTSNPDVPPTVAVIGPANAEGVAVAVTPENSTLYWTVPHTVLSCALESDGTCNQAAQPTVVGHYDSSPTAVHISKDGVLYFTEGKNVWHGAVGQAPTVLTTLDSARAVVSTGGTLLMCCKIQDSKDQGSIMSMEVGADPKTLKLAWENQGSYLIEASETGNLWWLTENFENPLCYGTLEFPGQFNQVQNRWTVQGMTGSGSFWYQPLVSVIGADQVYQCEDNTCQKYHSWYSQPNGMYRMAAATLPGSHVSLANQSLQIPTRIPAPHMNTCLLYTSPSPRDS
eukprot:TRINITY_DN2019_c0_g2_i7.p1 TRINITY_DN2019_c0_g2~~TRINITY_DN2019_c0_g2_i7.p1  ORF type:complete len:323 (-),score=61.57 TRINITY_DN2019_c0_g2_i7:125-1093(-)